ncbi:Putative membrane protein YdgH [Caulifigura coniformis]|uniref:Membrane protein YdgH n=1 Tax=Caulifigura coniformis TaxID=2527983 RepID=A0A517SHG0_9PLAN|nr:MMPL family transporter [Caulifigura coniformis]QDT55560.1 Putative membrane protein YdgH [Caulifigura coniformis]
MYDRLGDKVSRYPWVVVVAWALILGLLLWKAPRKDQVSKDGVFSFLPPYSQSLIADGVYRKAFFPQGEDNEQAEEVQKDQEDPAGSSVVIVIRRTDIASGLTDADKEFVERVLEPRLLQLKETTPEGRSFDPSMAFAPVPDDKQRIKKISSRTDSRISPLLDSEDGKATLIRITLRGEFLDYGNMLAIARIEEVLASSDVQKQMPAGLQMAISGSATVGRDMLLAEANSARSTDHWTKLLVIALLLLIYRAPIVALIPLLTVGIAVTVALRTLTWMASEGWVGFFAGMNVYVTVVAYGAGVDYCLFLIARFREQLDHGSDYSESIRKAVGFVGAALTASAATSICGIYMMTFAEFVKFQQAGFAISFGMLIVLLCSLTLTPALLRIVARWAFWPDVRKEHVAREAGWIPSPGLIESLHEKGLFDRLWGVVARALAARPGTIFVVTIGLMLPFAALAISWHDHLRYGLLTDLPQDDASVRGARAIQQHFPAGVTGTAIVLLKNEAFRSPDERELPAGKISTEGLSHRVGISRILIEKLRPRFDELGIKDVRVLHAPLGLMPHAQKHMREQNRIIRRNSQTVAQRAYVSTSGPLAGTVMRVDLVFNIDPFERSSISQLGVAEEGVRKAMEEALAEEAKAEPPTVPADLLGKTEIYTLGPTAGIRDLKTTTDRDQIRIDLLVMLAVYLVLVALLRQPAVSAYLIVTVVFSYLVTIGVTFLVWRIKEGADFAGLDWKVPIFTFTLLTALGEDYNILLMARVTEEQRKHGLIPGVLIALTRTGGIISSCGIIMAGTFCSLLTGTLGGMVQMGFALAFGVLLDTFVVRPILVPAYLILLYSDRFGPLGRILGKPKGLPPHTPIADAMEDPDDPDNVLESADKPLI